jgi:ketosteroid isomerase-like protein
LIARLALWSQTNDDKGVEDMARKALALVAGALLLAGCNSTIDPQTALEAVRFTEQGQLQSIASGDLTGVVRLYADDAVLVKPDGSRLEGGAAIAEEYAELMDDPNFALTIEPVAGWASEADDLAVLTSEVSFTTSDPDTGEATTLPMRSQTVWAKAPGGSWMIVSAYNVPVVGTDQPQPSQ